VPIIAWLQFCKQRLGSGMGIPAVNRTGSRLSTAAGACLLVSQLSGGQATQCFSSACFGNACCADHAVHAMLSAVLLCFGCTLYDNLPAAGRYIGGHLMCGNCLL
jgi:hypothetical protein